MTRMYKQHQLKDQFGRIHSDLRISVTDRCNLRCTYCMPLDVVYKQREEILTYSEITRIVLVASGLGVHSLRLTGGEPLLRNDLDQLICSLSAIAGVRDLAMTTNGLLLETYAERLRHAGLQRLNVSLDSLNEEVFTAIARRQGLKQVLAGLAAAKAVGFQNIRINAVSIRGLSEDEIVPLALFCRREGFHLRFIEFMPLDAEAGWSHTQVLTGKAVRTLLEREVGLMRPSVQYDNGQPAVDYDWEDGQGGVGFISPVSQPFCDRCDRVRLTADGHFRNCLFSTNEWDVRTVLRSGDSDERIDQGIADMLCRCVMLKRRAHGIGTPTFARPERAMYQIGG